MPIVPGSYEKRIARLLALIDSEEPPQGLADLLGERRDGWFMDGDAEVAGAVWRWLRDDAQLLAARVKEVEAENLALRKAHPEPLPPPRI